MWFYLITVFILWSIFGIGLLISIGSLVACRHDVAVANTYNKAQRIHYLNTAKRWVKGLAIAFALTPVWPVLIAFCVYKLIRVVISAWQDD